MSMTETATDLFLLDGHDDVAWGVIAAVQENRPYCIRISRSEPQRWVHAWTPEPIMGMDAYSANMAEHFYGSLAQGMDDAARLSPPAEWAMDREGDQLHASQYRRGYAAVLRLL